MNDRSKKVDKEHNKQPNISIVAGGNSNSINQQPVGNPGGGYAVQGMPAMHNPLILYDVSHQLNTDATPEQSTSTQPISHDPTQFSQYMYGGTTSQDGNADSPSDPSKSKLPAFHTVGLNYQQGN